MPNYRLISFNICPFVQRAAIVLQAKKVDYKIEYIDLANKPQWFLELSPLGKVPIVAVDDTVLFESQVIAEYLDEVEPPTMHPGDPLRRAQHRALIEVVSTTLGLAFRQGMVKTEAEARELTPKIHGHLTTLAKELKGPFFEGDSLSLVDAAAAPLLQRLTWVEEIVSFGFFEGLPTISAWRDALVKHPAVEASTIPEIRDVFREFIKGKSYVGNVLAQAPA